MADRPGAFGVLLELTRTLNEARPLEESLRAVTDAALAILPAEHASLRLLDDTGAELLTGARSGSGANQRPLTFRRGEGVGGWVVEHGEAARIGDVDADERFVPAPAQGMSIKSLVAVPLWSAGKVIGVLAASSSIPSAFNADHEDAARLLANCAVPPIDRARLARLAITDPQTRAFNQGYLMPRLAEEIERARRHVLPLALMMLDLDHFKRVNDEHGHAAGDVVLRVFVDRVRERVRRPDVLVRRGGEEFVLIMPNTRLEEAVVVAQRIRERTDGEPFDLGDELQLVQTVSIGVTSWDGHEDAASLERRADAAMYEAKRRGRNQVYADPNE